jgi:hypothetical protein
MARRLDLTPVDDETIRIISRLRHLTTKRYFDQRDFETLQLLIDELIHHHHLENFTRQQLQQIIHGLRLDRPLRTKSRAFVFIQERIPRRAVKYQVISSTSTSPSNSNVFDIWRERERRSRLDSKDSLEDEGTHVNGQQLRDVIEINHPTPPVIVSTLLSSSSNSLSKVKQMAKEIDTKSITSRTEINLHTADRYSNHVTLIPQSSLVSYPQVVSVSLYDVKTTDHDSCKIGRLPMGRLFCLTYSSLSRLSRRQCT